MDSSSTIVEFTRAYLAIFFSCVAVFYALRITAMKRGGVPQVVFAGEPFSGPWWNHILFRAFRLAIWMVCVCRYVFPGTDHYLGIFGALNAWPVVLVGDILLVLGFLLTVAVHFSLGKNWRSGIDPDASSALRTGGFYRYSRNPMFLGVAVAQVGFLLALPSVFSAVCLLFGLTTLYRQARAEEVHLSRTFPGDYPRYRGRVRRWL